MEKTSKIASREKEMDQLLKGMASDFNSAFPDPSDVARWIAKAYEFIEKDPSASDVHSVQLFLWYMGHETLPCIIDAKNVKNRRSAITRSLKEIFQWVEKESFIRAIHYIIYKEKSELIDNYFAVNVTCQREMEGLQYLEDMSIKGARYAKIEEKIAEELRDEFRRKLDKKRKEDYLNAMRDRILPSLERHDKKAK